MMNPKTLQIKLAPRFLMEVGYGEVYQCRVIEVLAGDFAPKELLLTVLPEEEIMRQLSEADPEPEKIILTFEQESEHVPDEIMPITGFVDPKMTCWKVIHHELVLET